MRFRVGISLKLIIRLIRKISVVSYRTYDSGTGRIFKQRSERERINKGLGF